MQEHDDGPRGIEVLKTSRTISVADVSGGSLPMREMHITTKSIYRSLGEAPLAVITTQNDTLPDESMYLVGPALSGLEVFAMFHFAAPSKVFGYDLGDLLSDWPNLYEQPRHLERLTRHRTIPGWEIFERDRELILRVIRQSAQGEHIAAIIPVVRIDNYRTEPRWNYSPIPDAVEQVVQPLPLASRPDVATFVPSLGPVLLASYSPEITESWSKREGYGKNAGHGGTQDMGSTQAYVQAIRHGHTLFTGSLFHAFRDYAQTGMTTSYEKAREGTDTRSMTISGIEGIIAQFPLLPSGEDASDGDNEELTDPNPKQ